MTTPHRTALLMLYAGAGLTALVTLVPFAGRAILADHIRAGYPAYDPGAIDAAVTAYLVILCAAGGLGLLGWLGTAWALRAGRRRVRLPATALLAAGVCFAAAALTVRDTSGDVGLAPLLGWLQVLPCVAGLAAVALWRRAR
ncbi:hypothetical protein [Nonomuraea sp. SBT364]|uniref:hypothetical protein n=1 Tax=Nonomuraea sp. SBT364 TaxID=1580530 RepID=UPI000AD8B9C5|nr:hypothetical protein [Nonomuraea sp. SBT364]